MLGAVALTFPLQPPALIYVSAWLNAIFHTQPLTRELAFCLAIRR